MANKLSKLTIQPSTPSAFIRQIRRYEIDPTELTVPDGNPFVLEMVFDTPWLAKRVFGRLISVGVPGVLDPAALKRDGISVLLSTATEIQFAAPTAEYRERLLRAATWTNHHVIKSDGIR